MKRSTYSLTREPVADAYRALVTFCSRHASEILVVVRQPKHLDATGQHVVEALQRLGASCAQASEWPGTKLTRGGFADVYRVPVSSESVSLVADTVDGLYAWLTPKMPEDLSFLRNDGQDILATVSHEEEAYLTLSVNEYAEVQADPVLSTLDMLLLE